MISLLLMQKILALFIIIFLGALLVKLKLLKPSDSKVISTISLYLITPCMIITAFEVDLTPNVRNGVILAFAAAAIIQIFLVLSSYPLGKLLKLDPVEKTSMIYSNAGNLVVPLVTSLFGEEWVIYSCAYISVQLFFMWSHGVSALCGEKGINFRKIITNINMISVMIGIVILIVGIRFPAPVQDAMNSIKSMLGPTAMLVTGMLIGGKDLKQILAYKKIWLIVLLRLVIIPLCTLAFLKYSGIALLVENGETILMISLLATITPSASSITQMAVVYGADADYASAINVLTTLGCIVTMPVMIFLYQL